MKLDKPSTEGDKMFRGIGKQSVTIGNTPQAISRLFCFWWSK